MGLVILLAAVLFVGWRWRQPKPTLVRLPTAQRLLAQTAHGLIYLAIIVQPILGILMLFGSGTPIPVFGLFHIPVFIPVSQSAASVLLMMHVYTGVWVIPILLGMHILAALYHALVRRDGILMRMWRGRADFSI